MDFMNFDELDQDNLDNESLVFDILMVTYFIFVID